MAQHADRTTAPNILITTWNIRSLKSGSTISCLTSAPRLPTTTADLVCLQECRVHPALIIPDVQAVYYPAPVSRRRKSQAAPQPSTDSTSRAASGNEPIDIEDSSSDEDSETRDQLHSDVSSSSSHDSDEDPDHLLPSDPWAAQTTDWPGYIYPRHARAERVFMAWGVGFIVRNPQWEIQYIAYSRYWAYIRIKLPAPLLEDDPQSNIIHCFSVHVWNHSTFAQDNPFFKTLLPSDAGVPIVIIAGDFNAVPSRHLDQSLSSRNPKWVLLKPVFDHLDLVDTFRILHPHERVYTHTMLHTMNGRRIDGIWISAVLADQIVSVEFHDAPHSSDHRMVSTRLSRTSNSDDPKGSPFWKLHPSLLRHPSLLIRLRNYTADEDAFPDSYTFEDWLHYKESLRTLLIRYSREIGLSNRNKVHSLQHLQQQILHLNVENTNSHETYLVLLSELCEAERLAFETNLLDTVQGRSKVAIKAGFRSRLPTSHLQNKGLYDPDTGALLTDPLSQIQLVTKHFRSSLAKPPMTDHRMHKINTLLRHQTTRRRVLSRRQAQVMEKDITIQDIKLALSTNKNTHSSPGHDGISHVLLSQMDDRALSFLALAFTSLMEPTSMPPNTPTLRTVLIPKKDQDRSQLSNWRPLSIPDAEIRLLGRIYATRLQSHIASLLPPTEQAGFVKGRSTRDVVVPLLLLLEHHRMGLHTQPLLLVSLDQEKAYDRIDRFWLQEVLRTSGYGPRFRTLIDNLYNNPSTVVDFLGHITDSIAVDRGLLQGEPGSCLLYNIAQHPLWDLLRLGVGFDINFSPAENNVPPFTFTGGSFADDTIVIIQDESQARHLKTTLDDYSAASTAKINVNKSAIYIIPPSPDPLPSTLQAAIDLLHFPTKPFPIKHLGHPLSGILQGDDENFHKLLSTLTSRIRTMVKSVVRKTSILDRVQVTNCYLLTKLWHSLSVGPLPMRLDQQVRDTIAPYIFSGNRNWVRWMEVAIRPKLYGGLGIIPTEQMCVAHTLYLFSTWVTRQDAAGDQFRRGFHEYLNQAKASGIHYVVGYAKPYRRLSNPNTRRYSFFGHIAWALTKVRVTLDTDWDAYTLDEVLALPWYTPQISKEIPPYTKADHKTHTRILSSTFWTFADILWINTIRTSDPHPCQLSREEGLFVPPSPSGIRNHLQPRPHRLHPDDNRILFACSILERIWKPFFINLPAKWKQMFRFQLQRQANATKDISTSTRNARPHDRPLIQDPAKYLFPWHRTKLNGIPMDQIKIGPIRKSMEDRTPIIPDWSFESTEKHWQNNWGRLDNLPLTNDVRSHVLLFLHNRPWLASIPPPPQAQIPLQGPDAQLYQRKPPRQPFWDKKGKQRQVDSSTTSPSSSIAPTTGNPLQNLTASQGSSSQNPPPSSPSAPVPIPTPSTPNDAQRDFHVPDCPLQGCQEQGVKDSASHGFISCHVVNERWQGAKQILQDLWGSADTSHLNLPISVRDVVLGWPGLNMVISRRMRLLLWRAAIIHCISLIRLRSFAASRNSGTHPVIEMPSQDVFNSNVRKVILQCLHDRFATLRTDKGKQSMFEQLGKGGEFWHVDHLGRFKCGAVEAAAEDAGLE